MDGDSGDEGNDELTCVRSDESDVFVICRQAKFLGKLIPETGLCVTERAVVDLQRGRGRWAREDYDI